MYFHGCIPPWLIPFVFTLEPNLTTWAQLKSWRHFIRPHPPLFLAQEWGELYRTKLKQVDSALSTDILCVLDWTGWHSEFRTPQFFQFLRWLHFEYLDPVSMAEWDKECHRHMVAVTCHSSHMGQDSSQWSSTCKHRLKIILDLGELVQGKSKCLKSAHPDFVLQAWPD